MPHAALWVVQPLCHDIGKGVTPAVSMPHAALWVVQLHGLPISIKEIFSFNAARGFVGGAAGNSLGKSSTVDGFNAARGFVGGAATSMMIRRKKF